MTNAVLILTQCASRQEAEAIAADLLDQRLVACASIGAPVESHYHWQGKRETSTEIPLVLKARRDRWPEGEAAIRRLHSYEVPEIIVLAVEARCAAYLNWLEQA
ncbi:MAG: divalent-cation tolerance protein CutA [Terriglobales bacterium]